VRSFNGSRGPRSKVRGRSSGASAGLARAARRRDARPRRGWDSAWADKVVTEAFSDDQGKMNLKKKRVRNRRGVLVVIPLPCWWLSAAVASPSFTGAAEPAESRNVLYRRFHASVAEAGVDVATGVFRAP